MTTLGKLRYTLMLFLFATNVTGVAWALNSVTVSFDEDRVYHPGDLVELSVSIQSANYERRELLAPSHRSARFLEAQSFPITKNPDGAFEQKWILLYQIGRSGEVVLENGFMQSESGIESNRIPLEVARIRSKSFGIEVDSDVPESLGETSDALGEGNGLLYGAVLILILGSVIFWVWKSKRERLLNLDQSSSPQNEAVLNLVEKLDSGRGSKRDIERFLVGNRRYCSSRLTNQLERSAYSKNESMDGLSALLREEFAL